MFNMNDMRTHIIICVIKLKQGLKGKLKVLDAYTKQENILK